jgi:pimeloyl-ACP methyl ester carboxylesterase
VPNQNHSAPPPHAVLERPLFLTTEPDATFAVVHLPAGGQCSSTGVVMCPLFGWEDVCTHRVRRTWAKAMAEAGMPTIRLDLPGTGDSAGSPRSPDQLAAWTGSLAGAAEWLREEFSCSRICAVGIGFGGMLAWLAAAQEAPIEDFVLWAVPLRGRRLIREIRAAAALSIDSNVDLGAVDPAAAEAARNDDVLLDESGQVTTPDTASALALVDITKTPLPHAERRRVLLIMRQGVKVDLTLADHLRSSGADITAIDDANTYGPLMQYVQDAAVPRALIAQSISWLSGPAPPPVPTGKPARPVRSLSTIELWQGGVRIRETPITIDLPSGTVCGILTEPLGTDRQDLTAAFFSGGSDRRIGPNRLWAETARHWAARGVTSVRLDPPGVGDAEGDERAWDEVRRTYGKEHTTLALELLAALAERGLPDRFLLVGFCSGAYRSIEAALRDPRVVGVFGIGMMIFKWTWWTHTIRHSWLASWKAKPGDSAPKARFLSALRRSMRFLQAADRIYVALGQFLPSRSDRVLARLSDRGTLVVLKLKKASYAYAQLSMPRRRARLSRLSGVDVSLLGGDDQRFRPLPVQYGVRTALDTALDGLIDSERSRVEVDRHPVVDLV